MFAVVRTGGKQYRVAAGDRIVVEKLDGEAGARLTLGDVLFTSVDSAAGITVAAEIVAQAKADKIIVFKKKRRHNYRRKNGHRQQHTILKILSVGSDEDHAAVKADTAKYVEAEPVVTSTGADTVADTANVNVAGAPVTGVEASAE